MRRISRNITGSACAAVLMLGVSALTLNGCGGGGTSASVTRGPVVSNASVVKAAATFPQTGNTVSVVAHISSTTALDVTNNPPTYDVLDANGKSFFAAPRPLTSLDSDPTAWDDQFNSPAGGSSQNYTVMVYAQDTFRNKGNTPFNAGTVALP